MAFVGTILQEMLKFAKNRREKRVVLNANLQDVTLRKLVRKAQFTQFGQKNDFSRLLKTRNISKYFANNVPKYDYNNLYKEWWNKTIQGEENVTWPGRTKYFALTSGTSEASSKRVPVTKDLIKQIRKTSLRQMTSTLDYNFTPDYYQKSLLAIGGSANLIKTDIGFEGDLSGIVANRMPVWAQTFYRPGKNINSIRNWEDKLHAIAKEAPKWDIAIVGGVPAWVKLAIERIIAYHNVRSIHEIWPNFKIYVHGGVAFAPYKDSFHRLFDNKVYCLDTYLASEGFMAFQSAQNKLGMQLVLDNGIYFEFVEFNDDNFDFDGNLKPNAEAVTLHDVRENVDYATLISTCAGTWRYLIGDTVRFKSLETFEVIISGRTKLFLSLCGEHLSIDNMNMAILKASDELNFEVNEFTVVGIPYEGLFAHKWYIGTNQQVDKTILKSKIDDCLKNLNDDYIVERRHALKEIFVEILPLEKFYRFMALKGKIGGQHKFPRVLKGKIQEEWLAFLQTEK